ncbi:hypothetical protein [Xanthomonas phaseoli]|uniref:hypothetical protein n=1 Tax=Xanthomonas phaseoli TaxID=1985254 RepID=UPI00111809E4|nr:hypothetical protein [Xanthomonas phaseoli]MBO9838746.1 hypothetical protein [Xanthomonas phaseoli pv. dieffenbachiae]MBO9854281.1 hypothetical protein [Xanthomonas phaseoli pv. dieffenbachiae]MBO9860995.1 hypothetical protein [Xanthomonas phaseoli pv. dieffenbachiae]MBO9866741.1 hypothetical protein [Xanthomonas phaseoli pv. dieffenbachiae]MBO9884203.1 hypothetical protein [Xanthomonas phaseoli pv. dieffenbachiae]
MTGNRVWTPNLARFAPILCVTNKDSQQGRYADRQAVAAAFARSGEVHLRCDEPSGHSQISASSEHATVASPQSFIFEGSGRRPPASWR